ncbi:hypothetical protein OQA88_4340 [Cercophora sp. LCS_1]
MDSATGNSEYIVGDDFSDYERVYLNMSRAFSHLGKEHWGIYCICALRCDAPPSGTDMVTAIRSAWMQLVVEHPGLSMVPDGLRKRYPRLNSASVESWARDTFFVRSDASADDVVAEANPRDLPGLYYLTASSEVLLLIQHWRADALGCCMMLDRLFTILASPNTRPLDLGDGPSLRVGAMSPSLESATGASGAEDPDVQAYARKWIDDFHARAVHSGGLPFRGDATTPPRCPRRYDLDLTVDETCAITAACKAHRISVTAAVQTALARTVFSYLDEAECRAGYTTVMAVNMRPYLAPPLNTKAHACQCYVTSITPTVPYKSDFVAAARALTHEYRNWWSETFMRSLRWIYKYHLAKISAPRPTDAAPAKPPSGVTLSSLGIVERHLRGDYGPNARVDKFRFGVSMQTRQMLFYVWTFSGRLTLSLSYNDAYYSDEMVKEVLSRVLGHLGEGLGADLSASQVS